MARVRPDLPRPGPPRRLTRGRRVRLRDGDHADGSSSDRVVWVERRPGGPGRGSAEGLRFGVGTAHSHGGRLVPAAGSRAARDRAVRAPGRCWPPPEPWARVDRHEGMARGPSTGHSAHPGAAGRGQPIRMAASVEPGARVPAAEAGVVRGARRIVVEGVVQGVGFRPFVWRLATELGLAGRVRNAAGRVEIEAAGDPRSLDAFVRRLRADAPPRARVDLVTATALPAGEAGALPLPFAIDESVSAAATERLFPPDIATCDDCLREVLDPADRRYRYPFTNCTNCGPRATIIDELPYDRARTTMRAFPLCPACAAEYADPANRRFHAEPVACPACGPRLGLPADRCARRDRRATTPRWPPPSPTSAAGRIVAIKGLGGYHLACDATDDVGRAAAPRPQAPLGQAVRGHGRRPPGGRAARPGGRDRASPAGRAGAADRPPGGAPARGRRASRRPSPPATTGWGSSCPYTPLHHLLMAAVGRPIVLTSGNLSDEPLATDDADAADRLAGLADAFLVHDREIRARYDDSVGRVVAGRASLVRRGRGYAPEALPLPVAAGPTDPRRRGRAEAHVHPGPRAPGPRRPPQRRPRGPADASSLHGRPRAPRAAPRPRARGRGPRPPPGVPLHEVRRRALPRRATHRRPAPPRPRRLVRRGARPHGTLHRGRLRRPGNGRRRDAVGRRDPRCGPRRLPPAGAASGGRRCRAGRWR